jgi:hypothetical protein
MNEQTDKRKVGGYKNIRPEDGRMFEIGNKASETWTEDYTIMFFKNIRDHAIDDETVLSLQDAFFSCHITPSMAYYLISKFPAIDSLKKDIGDVIVARINKKALNNKFNATASIWRFKQLGERDERTIDSKSTDGSMSPKTLVMQYKGKDIDLGD